MSNGIPSRILKDGAGAPTVGEVQEKPTQYTVLDRLKTIEAPPITVALMGEMLAELKTIHQLIEHILGEDIPTGES